MWQSPTNARTRCPATAAVQRAAHGPRCPSRSTVTVAQQPLNMRGGVADAGAYDHHGRDADSESSPVEIRETADQPIRIGHAGGRGDVVVVACRARWQHPTSQVRRTGVRLPPCSSYCASTAQHGVKRRHTGAQARSHRDEEQGVVPLRGGAHGLIDVADEPLALQNRMVRMLAMPEHERPQYGQQGRGTWSFAGS